MSQQTSGPITLALVDDYDVVVVGVAHMFDHYSDRVAVQELDAQTRVVTPVDIALLDTYGQTANEDDIDALVASPRVGRVVMSPMFAQLMPVELITSISTQLIPLADNSPMFAQFTPAWLSTFTSSQLIPAVVMTAMSLQLTIASLITVMSSQLIPATLNA